MGTLPEGDGIVLAESVPAMAIVEGYMGDVRIFMEPSQEMAQGIHEGVQELKHEVHQEKTPGSLHGVLVERVDRLAESICLKNDSVDLGIRWWRYLDFSTGNVQYNLDNAVNLPQNDAHSKERRQLVDTAIDISRLIIEGRNGDPGIMEVVGSVNAVRFMMVQVIRDERDAVLALGESEEVNRYRSKLESMLEAQEARNDDLQTQGANIVQEGPSVRGRFIVIALRISGILDAIV